MSRDAFFRDAVHFLRANLNLERLPAVENRGVQRLIEVRPRHGDVVFEPARHRTPDVVHHAERGIAVSFRIRDHADGEQVVHLLEAALLAQDLAVE